MNPMSDETKKLMEEYIEMHGIPIIACLVTKLVEEGCDIDMSKNSGNVWDAAVRIKKEVPDGDNIDSEFYFKNTFIEILCVDRDADPLEFDPDILEDGMYIFQKIDSVISGRLILLLGIMDGKTVEEIYKENPGTFERISKREVKKEDVN